MATMTAPVTDTKHIPGGSFLITDPTAADCFFPEDFTDEQKQIAETTANFAINEIVPASDADRGEGLRRDQTPAQGSRRPWPHRDRHPRGVRRPRDGQGDLRHRRGEHLQAGQLLRQLLRARRHRHAAAGLVRHRRAEAEVPAQHRLRQDHLRLRALGIDQRLRRRQRQTHAVLSPTARPTR